MILISSSGMNRAPEIALSAQNEEITSRSTPTAKRRVNSALVMGLIMPNTSLRFLIIIFISTSLNFILIVPRLCADNTMPTLNNGNNNEYREYVEFLNRLDKTDPNSILLAKEKLHTKFSASTDNNKNEAFRAFWNIYDQIICEANKIFSAPGNNHKDLSLYRKSGIDVGSYEGSEYLKEDLDFLLDASSITAGTYREYVRFSLNECRKAFVDDGILMISWDDLRQRIIRWEQFANQHSHLPETENDIRPQILRMVDIYLAGIDGSRILKSEDILIDDLRKSYETFLKENTSSAYYDKIRNVYSIWDKNQFKISKDLVTYLQENGNERFTYLLKEALRKQQNDKNNPVTSYPQIEIGPSSTTIIISLIGLLLLVGLIAQHRRSKK